jgi:hypothetical protein
VMITRVRKLTQMNISALDTTALCKTLGTTYAEFEGSPVQALAAVERAMCSRGIDSTYRSLMAVRRKLATAAPRYDHNVDGEKIALTPFVEIHRIA